MPHHRSSLLTLLLLIPLAATARATLQESSLRAAHHWDTARILAAAERYEYGRGVGRAPFKAYAFYCLGATRGDPQAAYALGWLYLNGRGVERDQGKAANWFTRAAVGGVHNARRLLTRRLAQIDPKADDACPLPGQARVKRAQARRWARALAPQYGLDSDLVEALVAAESSFNVRAHSPKDARGLMQLLPGTAKRFGVKKIWDPVENLRGGMAYLSWLLDRFDGKVTLALAAYNAGEHAVDRYQGIPPYKETQRYVKRIIEKTGKTSAGAASKTAAAPHTAEQRRATRLARIFQQIGQAPR